jgi:hypothetical protein
MWEDLKLEGFLLSYQSTPVGTMSQRPRTNQRSHISASTAALSVGISQMRMKWVMIGYADRIL